MKIIISVGSDSECDAAQNLISRLACENVQVEARTEIGQSGRDGIRSSGAYGDKQLAAVAVKEPRSPQLQADGDSPDAVLYFSGTQTGVGPLRCVFATDHSDYANHALDRLMSLLPKGISSLEIFSAIEPTCRMTVANLHRHLADVAGELHDAREITRKSEELASRISSLGISTDIKIRTGLVAYLIDIAVKDSCVDLLILGAQGENAQHGARLGAVATAVLQHANYPVLVLRDV